MALRVVLCIEIPDNFEAEDALSNALQDCGLRSDLVGGPVADAVRNFLRDDYGRLLEVMVSVGAEEARV